VRVLVVHEGTHDECVLRALLPRLTDAGLELEFRPVKDRTLPRIHGKGSRVLKRAVRWLLTATEERFDALVLLIDQDGDRTRVVEVDLAQATDLSPLPRAMGVAVRTLDAWMLADERGWHAAGNDAVTRQRDPERLRRPKDVCLELARGIAGERPLRDVYADVSATSEISVLETRCPRGFAPFAARVRAALSPSA
jgi:hypothetical protein